jgi:microcystin-dependent protein
MRKITLTRTALATGLAAMCALLAAAPSRADSQPYVGEIIVVPYSFCPLGFVEANGGLLPISEYETLFTLYGTTFGGDGQSTFGLPDQRGREPTHAGVFGGTTRVLGQTGGAESFTLTVSNLPAHTHQVQATNATADKAGPGSKFFAVEPNLKFRFHDGPPNRLMNSAIITPTGSNQPVPRMDPFLALRYCVAEYGVFPTTQ